MHVGDVNAGTVHRQSFVSAKFSTLGVDVVGVLRQIKSRASSFSLVKGLFTITADGDQHRLA
jgi:hypothetical protein